MPEGQRLRVMASHSRIATAPHAGEGLVEEQ